MERAKQILLSIGDLSKAYLQLSVANRILFIFSIMSLNYYKTYYVL